MYTIDLGLPFFVSSTNNNGFIYYDLSTSEQRTGKSIPADYLESNSLGYFVRIILGVSRIRLTLSDSLTTTPNGQDFISEIENALNGLEFKRVRAGVVVSTVGLTGPNYSTNFLRDSSEPYDWSIRDGVSASVNSFITSHESGDTYQFVIPYVITSPTFENSLVADQEYIHNEVITTLQLPSATKGIGTKVYATSLLPPGLMLDPITLRITGTPTEVGSTEVTLIAVDSKLRQGTISFTINVVKRNLVPAFASTVANQIFLQNEVITTLQLPSAVGGNSPLSYRISNLNTGLLFNADTLEITGTPTILASNTVILTVRDADGDEDTVSFDVAIQYGDLQPTFGAQVFADVSLGRGESIPPVILPRATGGNGVLVYSVTDLPPGVMLDPVGVRLLGTPTLNGRTTVTLKATDTDGDFVTLDFDIVIFKRDLIPSFGSSFVANQTFEQNVSVVDLQLPFATGGDAPLIHELSQLTDGMSFDSATLRVTGTPTVAEVKAMVLTVRDSDGDTDTLSFNITVEDEDISPFFPASKPVVGQSFATLTNIELILPTALGGNGVLSYSVTNLPPGVTVDSSGNILSGAPTTPGTYRVRYRVTDSDGDTADINFIISVFVDISPVFGNVTIPDSTVLENQPITPITLPAATGGNPPLVYSVENLGNGLKFNPVTRQLSGNANFIQPSRMIFKATDAQGDYDTLEFVYTINSTRDVVWFNDSEVVVSDWGNSPIVNRDERDRVETRPFIDQSNNAFDANNIYPRPLQLTVLFKKLKRAKWEELYAHIQTNRVSVEIYETFYNKLTYVTGISSVRFDKYNYCEGRITFTRGS